MLKKDVSLKSGRARQLTGAKNAATVLSNEHWPVKHLRVNVVAPIQDADVCLFSFSDCHNTALLHLNIMSFPMPLHSPHHPLNTCSCAMSPMQDHHSCKVHGTILPVLLAF